MSFQDGKRKAHDWSLNLEDDYYIYNPEELMADAVQGVIDTEQGYYVNLVTPGECQEPTQWLIPQLQKVLSEQGITVARIDYVDQCGCGGYVTRVYR